MSRKRAAPRLGPPTLALELDAAHGAVKITVSAIAAGSDALSVWRRSVASGSTAYVRGWEARETSASTVLLYDYEAPLGVELVYYAQSFDGAVGSTIAEAAPLELVDERDWLVDLSRPTNSFPILVESLPEAAMSSPVGVHRILDRRDPVLTTAPAWTPTGVLTFVTATETEQDRARAILGSGSAFLLKTPPGHGPGNLYVGTTAFREQRVSRLALHADRRFVVDVVQVARPDPTIFVPAPPLTYAERLAGWPTYQDVVDTGDTYQDLAYTFPPGRVDTDVPWLPDDV